MAAPLVDAIWGRLELKSRCENEGRLVIEKRVRNVEGIRVDSEGYIFGPAYWGFNFVERAYENSVDGILVSVVDREPHFGPEGGEVRE